MYENGQGHLTLFCIVFVWLRGRLSAVRSPIQDPWFIYQNRLGPSGGIYYLNFVPCFVYHQLNTNSAQAGLAGPCFAENFSWANNTQQLHSAAVSFHFTTTKIMKKARQWNFKKSSRTDLEVFFIEKVFFVQTTKHRESLVKHLKRLESKETVGKMFIYFYYFQ